MKRRGVGNFLVAVAAGAVFLLASGPAWADTKVVTDGNDVSGPLDIKSASHGHAGKKFLIHTVSMYEPFSSSFLQGGKSITFQFDTSGRSTTFERYVFVSWSGGKLRAFVANKTHDIGTASVSRPNARTLRVKIPMRLIKQDYGYRWMVGSFAGGPGFDTAPNGVKTIFHDIGGPEITRLDFPSPSTNQSPSLLFDVSARVQDPSGFSWQLLQRLAGAVNWATVAQGHGPYHVVGGPFQTITGEEGRTYEFRVRATDRLGNMRMSPLKLVSVPWDDDNAIFASAYGGSFYTASDGSLGIPFTTYFRGGVHVLDTGGTFSYTFTGTYVAVIALGTPSAVSGGIATVTIDGATPALLNLAPVAGPRRNVFSRSGLAPGSHTIVIARQSGLVGLDGFVFR